MAPALPSLASSISRASTGEVGARTTSTTSATSAMATVTRITYQRIPARLAPLRSCRLLSAQVRTSTARHRAVRLCGASGSPPASNSILPFDSSSSPLLFLNQSHRAPIWPSLHSGSWPPCPPTPAPCSRHPSHLPSPISHRPSPSFRRPSSVIRRPSSPPPSLASKQALVLRPPAPPARQRTDLIPSSSICMLHAAC